MTDIPDARDIHDRPGPPDFGHADRHPSGVRRAVQAVAPEGPLQVAVAVIVLAFLVGAIGYSIGVRTTGHRHSDLDGDFLVDMTVHHDQANDMALCVRGKTTEAVVGSFATEVLVFQNRELGEMGIWLNEYGRKVPGGPEPGEPERTAMAWMGMPVPVKEMPGMATEAQIDSLCAATGSEVDKQFLTLMRAHHRGGVHMAEYAAENATDPRVKLFAARIGENQKFDINEYTSTLRRLGFE